MQSSAAEAPSVEHQHHHCRHAKTLAWPSCTRCQLVYLCGGSIVLIGEFGAFATNSGSFVRENPSDDEWIICDQMVVGLRGTWWPPAAVTN